MRTESTIKRTYVVLGILCAGLLSGIVVVIGITSHAFSGEELHAEAAATVNGENVTVDELGFYIGMVKENRSLSQDIMDHISGLLTDKENAAVVIEGKPLTDIIKDMALELAIQNKVQVLQAKENNMTGSSLFRYGIDQDIQMKKTAGAGTKEEKEHFYKYRYGMSSEQSYENALIDFTLAKNFKETTMDDMQVDDSELQAYYAANRNKYTASYLQLKVISFSTVDRQGHALSEDQLRDVDKALDKVMQRITHGEDYDVLVREYSQDAESRENGGLRLYRDFDEAPGIFSAFRNMYTEADKIKGPLTGEHERFIAKFAGYSDPEAEPFERVKEEVRMDVKEEKYGILLNRWVQNAQIEYNSEVIGKVLVYREP